MTNFYDPNSSALPPLTGAMLAVLMISGCVATVAFDVYGQSLSPMMGFANLAPVPLATQTWSVLFGEAYRPGGHLLHYIAGVLAYPIGWMFVWRPIVHRILPDIHWILSSTLYGVGLWVFAMYVMAHLVAGNPPFLGFTGITWVALVGHVLYALVQAFAERRLVYRYEAGLTT